MYGGLWLYCKGPINLFSSCVIIVVYLNYALMFFYKLLRTVYGMIIMQCWKALLDDWEGIMWNITHL